MNDEQIIELFFARNESAIQQTADKYGPRLHHMAVSIVQNTEDAGTWELRWTLAGSQETPRTWTPNAKIGHWDVTLLTVEIGQYSMKATYQIGDAYDGYMDFMYSTGWSIGPAGLRLKDGTILTVFGSTGGGHWEPDQPNVYIDECSTLNTILDPSQIAGMYFYDGSEIDDQGWRVEKPYAYVSLE